jgi:hypothetical protein
MKKLKGQFNTENDKQIVIRLIDKDEDIICKALAALQWVCISNGSKRLRIHLENMSLDGVDMGACRIKFERIM